MKAMVEWGPRMTYGTAEWLDNELPGEGTYLLRRAAALLVCHDAEWPMEPEPVDGESLHGRDIPAIGVADIGGRTVLCCSKRPGDRGWRDRVEVGCHRYYSGIGIVQTCAADERDTTDSIVDRPTGIDLGGRGADSTKQFLISRLGHARYLVTAYTGLAAGQTPIVVAGQRKPKAAIEPCSDIDFLDIGCAEAGSGLLEQHVFRHVHRTADRASLLYQIARQETEAIFTHMILGWGGNGNGA